MNSTNSNIFPGKYNYLSMYYNSHNYNYMQQLLKSNYLKFRRKDNITALSLTCMSFTASTVGQKQPGCVFYSIHNSLESTNHRENGRPSLRPNIANKTPLYELAKCASMDSACVRVPQNGVHAFGQAVQNCLIALFVCGHS